MIGFVVSILTGWEMTTPILFISGLPRSGSTLLANLLLQNPALHATATNDLIELVVGVRDRWMACEGFKAQGLKAVEPRVRKAIKGLMQGFYADELAAGKTCFDKSRGWPAYIELLEDVFERPVKIVVTVRDIRDVVASFEKLFRKSAMTKHSPGSAMFDVQTVDGRARQLLSKDAVLGLTVNRVLDVFDRGLGDRLIIVPYRELTEQPQQTLVRIHLELGLPPFVYDPENVEQVTQEDDAGYGMDLHTIRSKVKPETSPAWENVLPVRVAEWLDKEYSDIQLLANRRFNHGLADFFRNSMGFHGGEGVCQDHGLADRLAGAAGALPCGAVG